MEAKYKIGDRVRVVNYGHQIFRNKKGKMIPIDMSPEHIGRDGIVVEISMTNDIPKYAIHGPNKKSWYYEDQMELV